MQPKLSTQKTLSKFGPAIATGTTAMPIPPSQHCKNQRRQQERPEQKGVALDRRKQGRSDIEDNKVETVEKNLHEY